MNFKFYQDKRVFYCLVVVVFLFFAFFIFSFCFLFGSIGVGGLFVCHILAKS